LANVAYKTGLDFGESLKQELPLENTIEDIALAMNIERKIFGMKASEVEKSGRKIVYHCHSCVWQKYFTPKLCIAIGQAGKRHSACT